MGLYLNRNILETYIRLDYKQHISPSFNITEQLVILGVEDNVVVTDSVLDLIMLMAKHYIFRCRCLKVTPNFRGFSKEVKQRAVIGEHILVNEGQPNYVFLALVPLFPTDQ